MVDKKKRREYMKEYYHRPEVSMKYKLYRQKPAVKERSKLNKQKKKYKAWKKKYQQRPEVKLAMNAYSRQRRWKLKKMVYKHYGGYKCAICGESREECLSVDHVNGDGYKHRKDIGSGSALYLWIVKHNYPKTFRILCMNCNHSLSRKKYYPYTKDKEI